MAHTKGLVTSIEKEGWAQVATERTGVCGGCKSTHSCHSCLTNSKIVTEVLNKAGAKEGDLVTVSLDSGLVLKSAAIMYLIPIAGLMAGALMGAVLSVGLAISETSVTIAFGFAGLCLGFFIAAFISRQMSANNRLTPMISQIIKSGGKYSPSSLSIDPVGKMKECPKCYS